MTKADRRIKGSFPKEAGKHIEVKEGNFLNGRAQFPLRELKKFVRRKERNF